MLDWNATAYCGNAPDWTRLNAGWKIAVNLQISSFTTRTTTTQVIHRSLAFGRRQQYSFTAIVPGLIFADDSDTEDDLTNVQKSGDGDQEKNFHFVATRNDAKLEKECSEKCCCWQQSFARFARIAFSRNERLEMKLKCLGLVLLKRK